MINQGKKSGLARIFFNQKFLTLVGLAVVVLVGWPFTKNAIKQYKINKEINDFKQEIAALQNKGVALKDFVSSLESDQFVEEYARLNLNLKKPGEEKTVIKIDDNGLSQASSSIGDQIFDIPGKAKAVPDSEISNPQKWFNYFFRK